MENYLEDRSIWEELEYYRDNHALLGKHPRIAVYLASDELSNKSDLEVMNIRKNAASNVSKWKKKLETVEGEEERAKALAAVDKWESMKSAAEKELETEKKLIFRKGTLEDGINGLLLKMERFSHPCDRGEFAHLLSAKNASWRT